ncbi:S1C family serine protease [Sphingomonas oligophenolica]|uniref:Serine protease n=1 Tax=Sphingomonas oligophenolica TaxID=301154 RepID=A0A502CLL2_9SPHN|nr:serine protease [Sphingomonas oligophenolica]TPG13019.1 serine protease [Sphingomonas oligophenolica]
MRWLFPILAILGCASPAAADDIGAAGRGVVRVVTIAVVDGQVVGFGHGSGVAVAPNRIVTNAHVMELADRYPDNVVIGVVPSEGDKSYQGKVVGYDSERDLALIEFKGVALPRATFFTGKVDDGEAVVALGYPGNVDVATARSAADYIRPQTPVRSEGVFSGRRTLSGIDVLLHTANIARGNSGGPLLDRCGRVIGINSAITRAEDGDSTFGFAIADSEVEDFLREAKQPFASVAVPCTSIEDRLRQDSEADARAAADAATATRDAAARAALAHEAMLATARTDAERARENVMGIAGLLLVLGALGVGAAGLLETQGDRRRARWAVGGGAGLMIVAVLTFVLRPSDAVDRPLASSSIVAAAALPPTAPLVCSLIPERSRVTVSSAADVRLQWHADGCVNGRTQYLDHGARWERTLVPDDEPTVSTLAFDPARQIYSDTRYLLSSAQMDAMRKLRGQGGAKTCTATPTAADRLAQQEDAIRAALPPLPNEKLVYSCAPASAPAH